MFLLDGKKLSEGVAFTDKNGTQYPSNWLNLSTEEDKAAIGITWVEDPVRADDRFYWDGDVNNPKDLAQLQSQYVAQTKDTAGKMLAQTDWYVIRKLERSVDIPSDVVAQRATIVAESNRLEDAINAANTVEQLIEVLNNQKWSD